MLEMLIVLAITAGILVIAVMAMMSFKQQNAAPENGFFNALEAEWKRAQYDAKYQHIATTMNFGPGPAIKFSNSHVQHSLTMPNSLTVAHAKVIRMRQDGNVQPQTIIFQSKSGQRTKMIIQMGWGVYRLERDTD